MTSRIYKLAPDDPRHGTTNGYNNLKCRCQPCRDAWAAWCFKRRHERKNEEPKVHGLPSTYYNWVCRCLLCKAAKRRYEQELYVRRKHQTKKMSAPVLMPEGVRPLTDQEKEELEELKRGRSRQHQGEPGLTPDEQPAPEDSA